MLPAPTTYDYTAFPPKRAEALRNYALRIRTQVAATTAGIIQIGRDLSAIKQQLEHGQFCAWVQAECGFTVRSAENYIRAHEFADGCGKYETVSLLSPTTVYKLAAKSTPPEIVREVIERASAGTAINDEDVAAALSEAAYQKREARRKQATSKSRSDGQRRRKQNEADRIARDEAEQLAQDRALLAAETIANKLGPENLRALEPLFAVNGWRVEQHLKNMVHELPVMETPTTPAKLKVV